MECGSLIDLDADLNSNRPTQRNHQIGYTSTAPPKDSQGGDADDPFADFFSMNSNATAQHPAPTALTPSPSSPPEAPTAVASASSADFDPFAGFGSPATLPKEEQQQTEPLSSDKQQQLSHNEQQQQQIQQRLLEHQYSHQHGRSEQLPFGHLQQSTPIKQGQAAGTEQQGPHADVLHTPLQQHMAGGTPSSISPSLQPVCERVATLGHILQQHGATQGEANASIRLLLATISAKQVKTRQLVASLTPPATPQSPRLQQQQEADSQQEQLQQQLAELSGHLAAVRSELASARVELTQAKAAEARQMKLLQQRERELQELKNDMSQSESSYQAEVDSLQQRLLDAEGQLARLSAGLPGGWRKCSDETAAAAAATTERIDTNSAPETAETAAVTGGRDVAGASDANGASMTPGKHRQHQGLQQTSSISLLTPDQAAAAQLKGWLRESQAALMEAQEDLMEREKEIKQLRHHLQSLEQQQQHRPEQQGGSAGNPDTGGEQQDQRDEQNKRLQLEVAEACAAAEAAQAAAAIASSARDSLSAELSRVQMELGELTQQVQSVTAARDEAVAALEEARRSAGAFKLEAEKLQSKFAEASGGVAAEVQPVCSPAAAAAAGGVAAAEADLLEAREAAAAALAEVAALQQQLQQVQQRHSLASEATVTTHQRQQQPDTAADAATESNVAQQVESSLGYQLLRATSENQALHSELADTKHRLLLLLQLVRSAAATITKDKQMPQQQELPAELDELSESAAAAAAAVAPVAAAGGSSDVAALDVACLLQIVSGLQQRYCCSPEHQQLLLRGKEMQFLLENALQQVHLIKAAGSDVGCCCPSESEYQQLAAGAAPSAATGHDGGPAGITPAASGPAAAADSSMKNEDGVIPYLDHATAATHAAPDPPQSACGSDALRGAAVGYIGSGAAGSQIGYTVVDEGLGYDGLDGSWWAQSSLGNTTADDLPDFLLPKAE